MQSISFFALEIVLFFHGLESVGVSGLSFLQYFDIVSWAVRRASRSLLKLSHRFLFEECGAVMTNRREEGTILLYRRHC